MYSRHHVLALGLVLALTSTSFSAHGKGGSKTEDSQALTKEPEKAAKEAEKSQRIELLAKMKQAEADATWPAGVPLDLPSGTLVKVRDSKGAVVLEGSLVSKK